MDLLEGILVALAVMGAAVWLIRASLNVPVESGGCGCGSRCSKTTPGSQQTAASGGFQIQEKE
jgi:hypothetical protein